MKYSDFADHVVSFSPIKNTLATQAEGEGCYLVDCSDGELSPLAPFLKKPEADEE